MSEDCGSHKMGAPTFVPSFIALAAADQDTSCWQPSATYQVIPHMFELMVKFWMAYLVLRKINQNTVSVHFGFSWSFVLTKTETALSDNIQNSKNTIFDCNWGNFFCFVQKTNYSDIHWTHAHLRACTHTWVPVCHRLENDCVYMFVYMSLVWAWAGLKRHTITCISVTLLNKDFFLSLTQYRWWKKRKEKKFFFLAIPYFGGSIFSATF